MIMQWVYVNLDNPLSQAVPCVVMEVNREVNKAVAQPKSGASTSCSGMQAPTEFGFVDVVPRFCIACTTFKVRIMLYKSNFQRT